MLCFLSRKEARGGLRTALDPEDMVEKKCGFSRAYGRVRCSSPVQYLFLDATI